MKIYEILVEEQSTNELLKIARILAKKCGPFLQQISVDTPPLFRGQDNFIKPVAGVPHMGKSSTLEKRAPTGSKLENHKLADNWFKEKFGIKFRSNHVVFSTSDVISSKIYGTPHIFIPKGNFQFCWSPFVEDFINLPPLYDEIINGIAKKLKIEKYKVSTNDVDEYRKEINAEMLKTRLEISNYQTTNLQSAIDYGNEIMFHCKEYYLLKMSKNEYTQIIKMAKEMI
jgi:hypothetical protein